MTVMYAKERETERRCFVGFMERVVDRVRYYAFIAMEEAVTGFTQYHLTNQTCRIICAAKLCAWTKLWSSM